MLKLVRKLRRWLDKRIHGEGRPWLRQPSIEGVFAYIHANNVWNSRESVSGSGSTLEQTRVLRRRLPELLKKLRVDSVLDIPCGDFHWLREVDLGVPDYLGADVVTALVEANQARFAMMQPGRWVRFAKLDLLASALPRADLILCRDCLVHFANRHVRRALAQIRQSGATYLLTTTFPGRTNDRDIVTGAWRPLNLEASPFCLPPPILHINEETSEEGGRYADKALALWRLSDLPVR
jgi:hypothetical protein